MFLKIAVLVAIIAIVWFGFRYMERRNSISDGRRKTGERTLGERLKKSIREKTGATAGNDPEEIEDTESCPSCGAFVSVSSIKNCGKPNCPY